MASVIGKTINGRRYYYLTESARVNGEPRVVEQHYLGTAEAIAAAVSGSLALPQRAHCRRFGDVAASLATLRELRVAET
ncbi:MAG: IS1634 family transposase, partial [Sciscionella sp.]